MATRGERREAKRKKKQHGMVSTRPIGMPKEARSLKFRLSKERGDKK